MLDVKALQLHLIFVEFLELRRKINVSTPIIGIFSYRIKCGEFTALSDVKCQKFAGYRPLCLSIRQTKSRTFTRSFTFLGVTCKVVQ